MDVKALTLRPLSPADPPVICAAFRAQGWHKPESQYDRYLSEQRAGARDGIVAELHGAFAGYVSVVWVSSYPPFCDAAIPEIVDLNVLKACQRRGIATALLDEAESLIGRRSAVAGIGVGLTADYGPAQILYARRGYVPDGRGAWSGDRPLAYGERLVVEDDLVLHLTRALR